MRRTTVLGAWLLVSGSGAAEGQDHGWRPGQDRAFCFVVEVVDGQGRPVPEAEVAFDGPGDGGDGVSARWHTGRRGRVCERDLLHGGVLEVAAPSLLGGRCAGATRVEYPAWSAKADQAPRLRVTLELRPAPRAVVRGRVVTRDRRPVAGATVSMQRVRWEAMGATCSVSPATWVRSDAGGAFVLPAAPRGRATLEIVHPHYADRVVELAAAGAAEVILDRGASWRGRVLDPEGRPLGQGEVWLRTASGRRLGGTCDGGSFFLGALPAGEAQLEIHASGGRLGSRELHLPVRIEPGERREQDVRWPPGATIAGQIITAAGVAVADATLIAAPPGGRRGVWIQSDAAGRFVFDHLPPGRWVLTWARPREPVRMEAETGSRDVRFVVPAGLER